MAKRQVESGFNLGIEQAEADALLDDAFYESGDYRLIASRTDRHCFVVGRTGAGKSAALLHLEDVEADHVVRINPEDLSLPYIADLHVFRYLDGLGVHLDLFWIALWKHVLLVEIIRKRYGVNTPEAKQKFFDSLRDRVRRDPGKQAALDYLDEFEGKFWCEADQRVCEITESFTQKINAEAKAPLGSASFSVGAGDEHSRATRAEEAERYQRIVNETQLARLNSMMKVLNDEILDKDQYFQYIVIDDLDRDWVDERLANDLIRCLFRTVQDLQRVKHLKVLVALRTNIFEHLDFGYRSGGQEEKFRSLVLSLRWSKHDLEQLLNERVRAASAARSTQFNTFAELLPPSNRARGNPMDYLLDRTLLRPRDAIAFGNECLAQAVGKARLAWADILQAERSYSSNRLLALRDEWKTNYPGIERVVAVLRRAPARMSRAELQERLDEMMLLPSDPTFPGSLWMTGLSQGMWAGGNDASWIEVYGPLLSLLFRLGLIGCAGASGPPRFFLDDPLLLESEARVEACRYFHVHRMYQPALDIRPEQPHGRD
jgi:hypothetical protein